MGSMLPYIAAPWIRHGYILKIHWGPDQKNVLESARKPVMRSWDHGLLKTPIWEPPVLLKILGSAIFDPNKNGQFVPRWSHPYATHGAGILTYMTGLCSRQMLVNVPAPWSICHVSQPTWNNHWDESPPGIITTGHPPNSTHFRSRLVALGWIWWLKMDKRVWNQKRANDLLSSASSRISRRNQVWYQLETLIKFHVVIPTVWPILDTVSCRTTPMVGLCRLVSKVAIEILFPRSLDMGSIKFIFDMISWCLSVLNLPIHCKPQINNNITIISD